VTLLRDPHSNGICVEVIDQFDGNAFRLPVAGQLALDAFRHPYARRAAADDLPVVLGASERLFGETSDQRPVCLVETRTVDRHRRLLVCSGQDAVDAEGNSQHPGDMAAQL
jgi:hypothetical protein